MGLTVWPDAVVERLRQLVADKLSGSRIADRLQREFDFRKSRCAVIGKVSRLQLKLNGAPHFVRPRNGYGPRRRNWTKPSVYEIAPAQAPADHHCTLLDLTPSSCRWPVSDDPRVDGFLYCGAATAQWPYCPHHQALGTEPTRSRSNGYGRR